MNPVSLRFYSAVLRASLVSTVQGSRLTAYSVIRRFRVQASALMGFAFRLAVNSNYTEDPGELHSRSRHS